MRALALAVVDGDVVATLARVSARRVGDGESGQVEQMRAVLARRRVLAERAEARRQWRARQRPQRFDRVGTGRPWVPHAFASDLDDTRAVVHDGDAEAMEVVLHLAVDRALVDRAEDHAPPVDARAMA